MNEEGNFVNMLNEKVNYTNWDLQWNDPNDKDNKWYYGGSDCVSIIIGLWRDGWCSKFLPALCSLRYNPGKCSKCQFKKTGWITNLPKIFEYNGYKLK